MNAIKNRYDFVLLFDVKDGNPNGDPDAGNLPRIDPETSEGLVTDVSLKRKVRNFVEMLKGKEKRYNIFIKEKAVLNHTIEQAYEQSDKVKEGLAVWDRWKKNKKKEPKPERHYEDIAREWMCENFFDVRTFGAVMTTGDKVDGSEGASKLKKTAGQVRGPVQLTFARSVNPIIPQEHSITRMAVTNEKALEKERTMGRKFTVPYGLYRTHGFISAHLAEQTGFNDEDLDLFWKALMQMFEHDRSAARGEMTTRGLYVFEHDSKLGNAPAHVLFERIEPRLNEGVTVPRRFGDYSVEVDESDLPAGVTLHRMLG